MKVVLLSTYDLGHQPFGLASPAAWLTEAGGRSAPPLPDAGRAGGGDPCAAPQRTLVLLRRAHRRAAGRRLVLKLTFMQSGRVQSCVRPV